MKNSLWIVRTGIAIGVAALLAACGDDDDDEVPPPAADVKCSELNGVQVASADIGLPTRGATVTSTELVPAAEPGPTALGEYCRILGSIAPMDPSAPEIRFQLNLPTAWNGKALMQGGGGYNGSIPNTTVQYLSGPIDKPAPLGRGYATFSSDSGHQGAPVGTSQDGSFGMNDEALNNFAADALKKTHDAAIELITRRYETEPSRTYFIGGSTGGREALAVVQRWPQDFDGAVSIFPAWNAATLDLFFGAVTRALAAPNGYPNPAKQGLVYDAVIASCDEIDGAADGIVSNIAACDFDVGTLRCPDGADTGDTCLSDPQIQAIRTYDSPVNFNYPLASGETQYPGFPVLSGADMRGPLALNREQPQHPSRQPVDPYFSVFWDQFVRFFVTRDPNYDYLQLDPQAPGAWQQRISDLTGVMDINQTDLSPFQARGGKLLMVHGLSDALVSHRSTVDYYNRLRATMTPAAVDQFVRFYTVPGYGHTVGTFRLAWDSLAALEQWVEQGTAPANQVAMDTNAATLGRTRPLCEYPGFPQHSGAGDLNQASSYRCELGAF